MRDENRYERTEGDRDRYGRMGERGGDERNRGELTNFGQFLGGHSSVAAELSAVISSFNKFCRAFVSVVEATSTAA